MNTKVEDGHSPSVTLSLHSHNHLPLDVHPWLILPVDPMAWGMKNEWVEHDALLSISEEGELAFWIPEDRQVINGLSTLNSGHSGWRCTGKVKTGRRPIRKARCSSAKKTALGKLPSNPVRSDDADSHLPVTPCTSGEELTIWDSKESEFASGLEFSRTYRSALNVMLLEDGYFNSAQSAHKRP